MRESNADIQRRYRTRKALAERFPRAEVEPKDVIVVRQGEHYLLYSDSGEPVSVKTVNRRKLAGRSST